jgi:hypothetical protein
VDQVVEATSAVTFPIISEGPAAVHVVAQGDAVLVAGLRVAGPHEGGVVGWATPGPRWVVTPTVAGSPSEPGVVIVNPGDEPATIELRVLADQGFGAEATLTVPAASVAPAPAEILGEGVDAILVVSDRPVVAAGGSTSLGKLGSAAYALALGIPVP